MTKHHLALGIYQKKLLKKFINYKNETQNHINSNYLSKNPQVYNLWIFYVLKPHFIEKFDQKTTFVRIMFESSSNQLRKTGTFSEQNPNLTRLWFDFDSTLTATKLGKFIVFRFCMKKHFQEIFLFPNPKGWKNILKILSKLHLLGTGKLILIKFHQNLCSVHSKYFFRKFANS